MHVSRKLTLLMSSVLAAVTAQAADEPFFTIQELSTNTSEYGYKLADNNNTYSSIYQKYDWWSYYDATPTEIDLSDRYTYSVGCYFDGKICGTFMDSDNENDGKGGSFFNALHNNTGYVSSGVNGGSIQDQFTGIRRDLGADGTIVAGWKETNSRSYDAGYRYPAVWNNGTELQLSSLGFGQASSSFKLDDGSFLVGGAASESKITKNERFYYCYVDYDTDEFAGDMYNCPGFHNKAAVWAVSADTKLLKTQYFKHNSPADDDSISTADIRKIVSYNGTYYAIGYSAYDEMVLDSTNVATYWTFNYDPTTQTFSNVSDAKLPNGLDRPTHGDEYFGSTWFADANDKGIAVGNARYAAQKNRSYPIEMFVYDYINDKTTYPIINKPFYGATNRVVAINNNNLIVGVSEDKDFQETEVKGNPRQQNGYIYNYNTNDFYSLNELICTSSSCEINGKYYYIYNVSDINNQNVIIANAYRYDTRDDWNNYTNATNVAILLTSDKFADDGKYTIPSNYVVSYSRDEITYGEDSGGGGSGANPLIMLLSLFGLALIKRRIR